MLCKKQQKRQKVNLLIPSFLSFQVKSFALINLCWGGLMENVFWGDFPAVKSDRRNFAFYWSWHQWRSILGSQILTYVQWVYFAEKLYIIIITRKRPSRTKWRSGIAIKIPFEQFSTWICCPILSSHKVSHAGFSNECRSHENPFHRRQHWKTEHLFSCHRHIYTIVTFINVNMHHQEGDGWLGNNVSCLSYSSSSPSTFITALPEDFYSLPKMDFSNNSSGFLLLTFPQFPRKYSTSLFSIARSSLPLWSLKLICLDEKELLEIGLKWHILMMILILGAMMLIFTFNR